MKRIFKLFPFIVFAVLLGITSCQKDQELESSISQELYRKIDVVGHFVKGDSIRQTNKELDLFLYSRFEERDRFTSEDVTSNSYDFTINTNRILQLVGETYTNYIFSVYRADGQNNDVLENYMLTVFNDGSYMQVLINYPLINNEGVLEPNISSATVTYINDQSLLSGIEMSPCPNTTEELINWDAEANCVYINCTAGDNHSYGQSCNGSADEQPMRICSGAWVVSGCITTGGSGSGSGSDPFTPPTGGGPNTGDPNNNPTEEIPTVPVFDLLDANTKRKLLEYSNTTIIKNKISDLGQKIFNPNYHLENGAMYKRLSDGNYSERLPDVVTATGTEFIPEFQSGEVVSLHMHAQKAMDYSEDPPILKEVSPIFSKIDVHKLLKFRKFREDTNENIPDNNDNDIVAMLATEAGIFALVVEDEDKMDNALTALGNDPEYNPTKEWLDFSEKFNEMVLNECDNDNNCIIKGFTKFLKDKHEELGDETLGIRLYQAVISNGEISRWKKL